MRVTYKCFYKGREDSHFIDEQCKNVSESIIINVSKGREDSHFINEQCKNVSESIIINVSKGREDSHFINI